MKLSVARLAVGWMECVASSIELDLVGDDNRLPILDPQLDRLGNESCPPTACQEYDVTGLGPSNHPRFETSAQVR